MEAERPFLDGHDGSGSWHPAMRPDSYPVGGEGVVRDLSREEHQRVDAGNEPESPLIPSIPTTVPKKPSDFGDGHARATEEPQQPTTHEPNTPTTPQMHEIGGKLPSQELETGANILNGISNHSMDPPPAQVRLPEARLTDQGQGMESIANNLVAQNSEEAQYIDSSEMKQEKSVHELVDGRRERSDVFPEYTEDTEAKEEMDNAFSSEPDQEVTNNASALGRTNSFPEVPPLHESTILPTHALPKSQSEDVMEEDEALDQYQTSLDDDLASKGALDSTADDDNDDDFFANMGGAAIGPISPPPADEEVRYEEGLPLVPSEHLQETEDPHTQLHNFYPQTSQACSKDNDAGIFENFAPTLEDSSSFRPQPLDRKTTTQVLDAIHYAPHSIMHPAPEDNQAEEPKDIHEERSSLADMTGGGIAVSAQTVKSEVFVDERLQPKSKEDDLAEMWKAALGDDDLLDENETPVDPSTLFGDDEGFLDDIAGQDEDRSKAPFSPPLEPVSNLDGRMQRFGRTEQRPTSVGKKYIPTEAATQSQQSSPSTHQRNQYPSRPSPQMPSGVAGQRNSVSTPVGFGGAGVTAQQSYGALAPPRPQMPASTQSFADKSKGGYTSPYDLPMDITRPKKRNNLQQNAFLDQTAPNSNARVPPPRSSSMFPGVPPSSQPQPPLPNVPRLGPVPVTANPTPPMVKASQSTSSFFEDLAPKPRPSTSTGKYTPPPPQHQTPHAPPMAPSMSRQASIDRYSQKAGAQATQTYQLRQPEKMGLFGNNSSQLPPSQPVPAIDSRYSPAPPQPSSVPPSRTRYASSPMGNSQPSMQGLPFQPRTSSPLAQSSLPRQPAYNADSSQGRPNSDSQQPHAISRPAAPQLPFPNYQEQVGTAPSTEQLRGTTPPLANSRYAPLSDSPSSGSQAINTPSTDRPPSDGPPNHQSPYEPSSLQKFGSQPRMPPQRSQTQSPGAARASQEMPPNQAPFQRPASVSDKRASVSAYTPGTAVPQRSGRARAFSEAINYIRPVDGREMDPLERWKGCPIVAFGFGGSLVTSFPVQIPRYTAGQKTPMVKCSPGEVKIRGSKFFTLDENVATFPGPLKAKSKKKEVLEWLQNRISHLENNAIPAASSNILPDPSKCHQEKILLWKTVKVFVEHDGVVDGNKAAEQAVRAILSPELSRGDADTLPVAGITTSSSCIVRRGGSTSIPENVNQNAIEELRKILLHGDREKAVWLAVDNRMWAHAMLIATTLDPKIWKQVSSEFIKQEVKSFGENTESLSALYQIFSGNGEESIDELVPPSARAGLQMVSKATSNGPTKNALDGLDRWRETLTLIMSNRTPDDGKALVSLGQLLAGYGRTEAAHICYIFAKSPALFGGPDDPQVSVALLGADHIRQPSDYVRNMDSVLLTEVYYFALTNLTSSSAVTISPHLQSYKLYHAMVLAEYGYKTEAQQYCDAITSALKSTTRLSPYYHPLLFGALENLTERLRQAPKEGSGSWIPRPSIDKVSGSIWAKFNSYVAGDESDAASTGSGMLNEAEAGPFARVAGDSPSLSRSPSVGDLYGSHPSGLGLAPAPILMTQPVHSRYAPAGLYTPRSSQEQPRNSLQEPQRQDSLRPAYTPQQYQSKPVSSNGAMHEQPKPQFQPTSYAPQQDSYLPTPPTQPEYMPEVPPDQPLHRQDSYQSSPPQEQAPHAEQYQPSFGGQPTSNYGPPSGYDPSSSSQESPPTNTYESSGYEPPSSSGYEPPAKSGYEHPSYNPPSYSPNVSQTDSPPEERPKRRDIMDEDEDDFEARAAAMRKEERVRKDREADELMRKVAEEDGRRPILSLLTQ